MKDPLKLLEEAHNEFGMTREEQMWQAVEQEHGKISQREAFVALTAMEWADKTMIEKACKYLRQSLYNTPIFEHDEDENPVNYVCASCCDSVEEFIENFCKAMEE